MLGRCNPRMKDAGEEQRGARYPLLRAVVLYHRLRRSGSGAASGDLQTSKRRETLCHPTLGPVSLPLSSGNAAASWILRCNSSVVPGRARSWYDML